MPQCLYLGAGRWRADQHSEISASFPETEGWCQAQLSPVQEPCCHLISPALPTLPQLSLESPSATQIAALHACARNLLCCQQATGSVGRTKNSCIFMNSTLRLAMSASVYCTWLKIAPYTPLFISNHSCRSSEFFCLCNDHLLCFLFTGWFTDLLLPSVCWHLLCRSYLHVFCPAWNKE